LDLHYNQHLKRVSVPLFLICSRTNMCWMWGIQPSLNIIWLLRSTWPISVVLLCPSKCFWKGTHCYLYDYHKCLRRSLWPRHTKIGLMRPILTYTPKQVIQHKRRAFQIWQQDRRCKSKNKAHRSVKGEVTRRTQRTNGGLRRRRDTITWW